MDTAVITKIYLQRPISLMAFGLGQWFVAANGLDDQKLVYTNTMEAKERILDQQYHHIPNLEMILNAYNRKFAD
jgi:hypothetical protein